MPKIYTKTGDKGETGLFGGSRVSKGELRIRAYGEVDELNAVLGVVRSQKPEKEIDQALQKIQNDLFDIGTLLATPDKRVLAGKSGGSLSSEDVTYLENLIDHLEKDLPPLKNFILPGGSESASFVHWARTVCRRAEREVVTLSQVQEGSVESEVLIYLNRLSDLLFVMARWVNLKKRVPEMIWQKKA